MRVLGWIFVPVLMLYRTWGALNIFQKTVGILWALISSIGLWRLWIPILIVVLLVLWIKNKITTRTESHAESHNKCIYCGEPVSPFKNVHTECQKKHKFGEREIEEVIPSAFSEDYSTIDKLKEQIDEIAETNFINQLETQQAVLKGWENSVEIVLADRLLSHEEEELLANINEAYQLDDIRESTQGYPQLVKAGILRDVTEGKIPEGLTLEEDSLPFNFEKSEKLVWVFPFPDVEYFETRTTYDISGYSSGSSIGLFDDVYVSSGSFHGRSIETETLTKVGKGTLAVTDRHLYFTEETRTFRINFDEIISFEPFKDALGIYRDALKANYQVFKFKDKEDPWFACNLIKKLARLYNPVSS